MNVKTKLKLNAIKLGWWNHRSKKIAKKISKETGEEKRYPEQWKNDFVLKKMKKLFKMANIELEVKGRENLTKAPAILAPNHSSMLDPAFIVTALENPGKSTEDLNHMSVFIAKDDIAKNKRAKGWAGIMNTFYINRDNPREAIKVLDDLADHAKKEKKFIVIFPEGTRTKDGKIDEFKGGAFRIAKKSFMPIIPVTINNAMASTDMTRTEKVKVEVIFHPALKPMSLISQDTKSIGENVRRIVNSKYKTQNVKQNDAEQKLA